MFLTRGIISPLPRVALRRAQSTFSQQSSLRLRFPSTSLSINRSTAAVAFGKFQPFQFHTQVSKYSVLLSSSFHNENRNNKPFDPYSPMMLQTIDFSTKRDNERARLRAQRRARAAGVLEKDREEEQRESVTGEPVSDLGPRVRQVDALSDGANAYIRNVWGLVGANLGVCSVGTVVAMTVLPVSPIIPGIASIGLLLGLSFGAPKGSNPVLRAGLLGGFAFTTGMTLVCSCWFVVVVVVFKFGCHYFSTLTK